MSLPPVEMPAPRPQSTPLPPGDSPLLDPAGTGPIRAALLGLEGLEDEARRLAIACTLAPGRRAASPLLRRFEDNRRALARARREILVDGRLQVRGLDAAWLADNFHIVDEVLREIRLDMPRGYDAILPKLDTPPLAGYPRVHAIALALVAHTDGELDEARIDRFVKGFQDVTPLTIGELWALPTMLRLVVIENLRRLSEQMLSGWRGEQEADRWAAAALAAPDAPPPWPAALGDTGVVRVFKLLQERGPAAAPLIGRVEAELTAQGP